MKKGDKVILTKGSNLFAWLRDMEKYVGKEATITAEVTGYPVICWYVDTNPYFWCQDSLILVGENKTITVSKSNQSGAHCIRCKDFCEYAEPSDNFKCWRCKH